MPKKADLVVKESNVIARARLYMPNKTKSVWDERIISLIVAKNRVDDTVFQTHSIGFKELADVKKLSTDQHREIKRSVRNLAQANFGIPKGQRGETFYPIFAMIDIDDDGNITAQINAVLKPHYLELKKRFALRELPEFRKLTGVYSQNLFRFLNSWCKTEIEIVVSLEELHGLLGTPPSFRKHFGIFRTNVLDVTHKEINDATSLEYDWEAVKEGKRKVVAVRFVFDVRAKRRAETIERIKELKNGMAKPGRSPEDEEIDRYQAESNSCYEKFYKRIGKPCAPRKRSKKCRYCVERGRMRHRLRKQAKETAQLTGSDQ